MVLPQANVTDAAHSCARNYRTPDKVSGTERDGAMPRGASSSETNCRLSLKIPSFVVISISPAQFREQDGEMEVDTNLGLWKLNLDLVLEKEASRGVELSLSVPITFPVFQ